MKKLVLHVHNSAYYMLKCTKILLKKTDFPQNLIKNNSEISVLSTINLNIHNL